MLQVSVSATYDVLNAANWQAAVCKCWADHAVRWCVLQNLMKMVETKGCAEADQPEVRLHYRA